MALPTEVADTNKISSSPAKRPPLTVQIENIAGVVKPLSIPSAPGSTPASSLQGISGLPPSSSTPTFKLSSSSGAEEGSSSGASATSKSRARQSTFLAASDSEGWWAPRPLPEDMYEKLDQYFPEHDLDKPVIEAVSGGTSPTATTADGLAPGVPPLPPIPPEKDLPQFPGARESRGERDRTAGSSDRDRSRIRAKKSIRIVAQEHKKKIDRTSMASHYPLMNGHGGLSAIDSDASRAANMLRKRSTKLWGSKLEEVTTENERYVKTPESPSVPGPSEYFSLLSVNVYQLMIHSS